MAAEVLFCLYSYCYTTTDSAILKHEKNQNHLKRQFLVALNEYKPCKSLPKVLKEFNKITHDLGQ